MSEEIQVLSNGYHYVIGHPYAPSEASAAIAKMVVAALELISSLGLLAAILFSAFNTRSSKDPNLFVRTHSAIFFVCLVLCTAFQAVGGLLTSNWIRERGVHAGAACTTQAIIKHVSDVGIALYSLVIAVYSFQTLRKKRDSTDTADDGEETNPYSKIRATMFKWLVVAFSWFILAAIVVLGPEITSEKEKGDFYGVAGEWCYITDGYLPERVAFAYGPMIASSFVSLALYVGAFYHNRKQLRVEKPGSEYILSEQDQADEYALKLSRYMIWYPLAYFCCLLPLVILRFVYWSGFVVPFGATIFTDIVYHLLGIVNTIIFICTPRLLPPRTVFPSLFNANSYAESRAASYANPRHKQAKTFAADRRPPPLSLAVPAPAHTIQDPFATPVIDEKGEVQHITVTMPGRRKGVREQKVVKFGLPTRPGSQVPPAAVSPATRSRLSTSYYNDEKDITDDEDETPIVESLPYGRLPAGLPGNPAAPMRGASGNATVPGPVIEHSSWSTTTGTTATAVLDVGTAYSGSRTSLAWTSRPASIAPTDVNDSPLPGATFQMVTQPGLYVHRSGESTHEGSADDSHNAWAQ
ncbi:unnamed protein product [Peniophora sp. CBMAI 1063]|nr:unnamed protein product [Peniophora sp. CBMAI 1063]